MHKFTVFSILFSLSVVLILLDVLTHNYLGRHATENPNVETPAIETPAAVQEPASASAQNSTPSPESTDGLSDSSNTNGGPSSESSSSNLQDPSVQLQSVEEAPESWLSVDVLTRAGFQAPVLKSTPFSELVFQFLSYTDAGKPLQWNIFDGEDYIGTVVELVAPTETEGFQTYLHLREAASHAKDIGSVNEVNNYGDASFYFNHSVQTKTVRLVIRYDERVFAFEYKSDAHDVMKKLFDILKQAE